MHETLVTSPLHFAAEQLAVDKDKDRGQMLVWARGKY